MATKLFIFIALALSVDQISALPANKPLDDSNVSAVLQEADDVLQLSEAITYQNYYEKNALTSQTEELMKELMQRDDDLLLSCILQYEDDIVNTMNGTHYAAKHCTATAKHAVIIIALKIHAIKEQIHAEIEAGNFIISSCADKPLNATEKLACISDGYVNNGQRVVKLVKALKLAINIAKPELKIIYELTKACLSHVLESGYDSLEKVIANIIECAAGK
ncbi:uncharacterized protein LOC143910316 [Arctopsyche grandis]|uniref:uncharacterized protein LOC143910316 n=1 Tax=Arctopsyche grandis TaxID=121162 RepID=UPI00406D9265